MSYFDHVLMFSSEQEAKDTLTEFVLDGDWVGSVIPNLNITIGETVVPGFFINIALPEVSQELIDLPNSVCRLVTDREAAKNDENFFIYVAPTVDLQTLSTGAIYPVFMGSEYPFCE